MADMLALRVVALRHARFAPETLAGRYRFEYARPRFFGGNRGTNYE